MLSKANSELVTQIGPGTPLGEFMREYWIPVLRSSQVEAGGNPRRFKILGETFVAFRSEDGEVGVMDEACPHRGASMALARNEKCGLRCIYHGWKISPKGDLVEAPTHPPGTPLHKMKMRSHPVWEGQGMIWTWLGKGEAPAFRHFAWTTLPDDHVINMTMTLHCDWLAPLETLWDIFHAQILHNDTVRSSYRADYYFSDTPLSTDTGLKYDIPVMLPNRTDYGFEFINRDAAKDTHGRFILPFFQHHAISPDPKGDKGVAISIPIDERHTLNWEVMYNRHAPLKPDGLAMSMLGSYEDKDEFFNNVKNKGPRTPEHLWGWGQDREAMARGESFAGFIGNGTLLNTMAEDFCVLESRGQVDRTREMLAPVDLALVEGRQTVIDAVKAHMRGEAPLGRDIDVSHVESEFHVTKNMPA